MAMAPGMCTLNTDCFSQNQISSFVALFSSSSMTSIELANLCGFPVFLIYKTKKIATSLSTLTALEYFMPI